MTGKALLALLICFALMAGVKLPVHAESCPSGGEHDYKVKLVRQASNTENGLRTYTCVKCGHTYDEVIENFGHHWSEWRVLIAPDCENEGVEERRCEKCGDYERRYVESLGHLWGEWHREGDKEVRICERNDAHRQERLLLQVADEPEAQPPVRPTKPLVQTAIPETATVTPPVETIKTPEPQKQENIVPDHEEKPAKGLRWTSANTAVAVGGSLILTGLGFLLFISYIYPWLWILRRRKEKKEELQRKLFS